jgi:hypothetical protein
MKRNTKGILLCIVGVLIVLCLCSCGSNAKDSVLGTWVGNYVYESSATWRIDSQDLEFRPKDKCEMKLELFKGDTLQITRKDLVTGATIVSTGTWTFKEGVVHITQDNIVTIGYDFDKKKNILTLQQQDRTMFAKELRR